MENSHAVGLNGVWGENTLCICVPGSLKDVVPHSTILPRVKAYEMGSLVRKSVLISSLLCNSLLLGH